VHQSNNEKATKQKRFGDRMAKWTDKDQVENVSEDY
jgi:hypothetical protein